MNELSRIYALCRRHVRIVLVAAMVGFFVGLVYLLFVTPRYQASATLVFNAEPEILRQPDLVFLELDTHANIIRSPLIIAQVIEQLSLEQRAEFSTSSNYLADFVTYTRYRLSKPLFGEVRHLNNVNADVEENQPEAAFNAQTLAVMPKVGSALQISRLGNTKLLQISFESISPELAAEVSNTFVDVYLRYLNERFGGIVHCPKPAAALSFNNTQQRRSQRIAALSNTPQKAESIFGLAGECEEQAEMNGVLRPSSGLRLVSTALVPQSPVSPKFNAVLVIFTTIGFVLGLGLALRSEWSLHS